MGLKESIKQFQVRFDNYRNTLLNDKFNKVNEAKNSLIKYLLEMGCPAAFIPFNSFPSSRMPQIPVVPSYITIGHTDISVSKDTKFSSVSAPFLLPLCHNGAFLFEGDLGSMGIPNLFQLIMLRLSLSIPLELCKFHMVDCDYGRSFAHFNSLQNPKIQKTLYGPDQVHGLFMEMESVMRNMYSGEMGKYSNLSDYNSNNTKSAKPYNFIFIDDFPSSCPYQALDQLKAMINNGNAMNAGIYLFINYSATNSHPRELEIDYFREHCAVITSKANGETSIGLLDIFESQKHSNIVETNIPDAFDEIATLLNLEDEVIGNAPKNEFYKISENEIWAGVSMSEINIPVGITDKGELAIMHFTQKNALNSALVVGSPGFGKSKFLHSLILNAALRYSPDELEMYLLDFSGVEFDVYARMNLPHAKIIAPESEREFGVNILEEIYNEGIRRERLCRDNAVDNTEALRKKNNQLIVPRILVIIDEFQELFQRNDKMSSRAYFCINNIIQKYRKFAINLVLSSQKAYQVTSDISIDEIGNRIAFSCHPRDSILVGLDNTSLNLPGGNFIYNDAKGAKNSNINAKTFYIEGDSKENVGDVTKAMNVIQQAAKSHTFKQKDTIVYRSKDLPQFNPSIIKSEDLPKEIRLYFGQSFAIRNSDIYVPIIGDSNDNVLIIGGETMISQEICMFTMMSAISTYRNKEKATFYVFDFLRTENPLHNYIEAWKGLDADIKFASKSNDIVENLKNILDEIERRKEHYSNDMKDIYIFIYAMELGQPFKAIKGNYGFEQSEAMRTLGDILREGPLMHVHTVLQIDNYYNLYQAADNILWYFNHRIALQMTSSDSNRLIESDAASNLEVDGNEWTKYRGYYYNQSKNSLTKFRPYNSQISKD
ncbi:MAG: hypothetical protein IKV77_12110 [Alistipes sp.]|nr:hypothetical protein [Alistipes sp.]